MYRECYGALLKRHQAKFKSLMGPIPDAVGSESRYYYQNKTRVNKNIFSKRNNLLEYTYKCRCKYVYIIL